MKRQFLILFTLVIAGYYYICPTAAQTDTLYYLNSSFETPEDQAKWSSIPVDPTIKWNYDYGGHNWPISPKSGDFNAVFYRGDFGTSYYRALVSEPIDLSTAEKPQFSFWHVQDKLIGQDELTLLFKAGSGAPWDTIAYYPDEVGNWAERIFNIHEVDTKYLCEGFQISFLGLANGGNGVCIDSVLIKETATIAKFVKSYDYQDVDHLLAASGTTQLPLIRVRIEIMGNNGSSILNSMSFRLNSGDPSYFRPGGFKLFHTLSDIYKTKEGGDTTHIGAAVSISGGNIVTFSGINETLKLGNNYLWLTADLADDIPHHSNFSFGVDANAFQVNDTLLPAAAINNIFSASVEEAVFYDNFDIPASWTIESDFEFAIPEGKKIGTKSRDPEYAYSGNQVLGTDLTVDGAYPYAIASPYHVISPMINLQYYNQVKVYMRKWIDFNPLHKASISFSTDGGNTWSTVWQSQINNPVASTSWDELLFNSAADNILSRHDSVRIRFSVLETSPGETRAGFNIDNFTITGNYLDKDVGITRILSPFDDCLGYNNDTVRIVVKNYAAEATPIEIPVYFGLWGADSTLVHETITGPIAKDDSLVYTFTNLANFPRGDFYNKFLVGLNLPGDEDLTNDTLTKPVTIPDSYISPASIDFEYKGGIWLPSEGSTWLCKVPDGSIPILPASPNSWILSPFGDYLNEDTSWVESNCFDLTWANRHIIDLDYWLISEDGVDGAAIEYSTDDGQTWNLISNSGFAANWGWYSTNVTSLGHDGWSGNSNGWTNARELLPEPLNTEVKIKFRVLWASDAVNNSRGLAFDNFKIYPAPSDVGVSSIELPKDTCQFSYLNEMHIWVKNYGLNDLSVNDTMIVGFDFESEPAVIDTFLLTSEVVPGDSTLITMSTTFDINTPGLYQIKAYTLSEVDPYYYGSNNDTLSKSFTIWQNPLTGLMDTISSRQPDTLLIEPVFDPDYSYLWGDLTTTTTYDVGIPGTYYLTVTESVHGCQTSDSVYIELLFNDVGIDHIISPQSSCELGNAENVQLRIHNFGTDSLIIGEKIYLFYEFDGAPAVVDSLILDSALYSGSNRLFTFSNSTIDLTAVKDYTISAYTYYGGDTVTTNNGIDRIISVYGYPNLELGPDLVITALEHTLNVDPSFESYLWENGDTNSSRLIDTSGHYRLDIIDNNGCDASDSIDIWFKIRDVRPDAMLSPISSCNREAPDAVSMRIQNFGTDTIFAGDNILVSYRVDAGTRVNESFNITGQLLPGGTVNHTFTPLVDITDFETYTFELIATTTGDLRQGNDTLTDDVITNTNPVVDLGVDDDDIFYQTELVLDAGPGPNYGYLWHDGSTNRTYTVTDITNVRVLVVDSETGCYGGDTVFVYLDILDYMVTNVDISTNACLGNYNDVRVTLLNNGNLPRGGAEIDLDYFLDGDLLFSEEFVRTENWQDGVSLIHTTAGTIPLNELGPGQLTVSISTAGDLRPENDNYIHPMEVVPNPEVAFDGTPQEVDYPYILDAGSGHSAYLWSTGATTSSITTTEDGTYSVTVTGTNGCRTIQSVYIDDVLALSPNAEDMMHVLIYPNPARDMIRINAEFEDPGVYMLEIFNSQNSVIMKREINTYAYSEEFYVGDLPRGVYFVRFRKDGEYHISKIIIH
jgi:hypothetical protein